MLYDARLEKIATSPEAFLTDETGQLRMRYSTLATIIERDLYEADQKRWSRYNMYANSAPL